MQRRCCEEAVDDGNWFAFGGGNRRDRAPSIRDSFIDRQNPVVKAGAEVHLEPGFQSSPARPGS